MRQDVSETSPERGSGDAAGGSSDYYSNDAAGTLRPPPTKVRAGDTTLTIFVQQWGFKEVDFQHARVIVSVRDDKGNKLEAVQETPFAGRQTMNYVVFDQVVYVQTPLNRLPPGAAIFFEFTHYKVAKKKRSCKAYCYMEMDEVRPTAEDCWLEAEARGCCWRRPSIAAVEGGGRVPRLHLAYSKLTETVSRAYSPLNTI